jgi:membrane fusion protein, multidrug efflux system
VRIKAIFPNGDERLWPGEFVNAWLRLDVRRGAVVPEAVVQSGPNGTYAYVIAPDGSVEPRPLQVAGTHQGEALIAAGLAAGDRVVVDGQYRLRPGAKVIVAPEPKPAPGAAQKTADARAVP